MRVFDSHCGQKQNTYLKTNRHRTNGSISHDYFVINWCWRGLNRITVRMDFLLVVYNSIWRILLCYYIFIQKTVIDHRSNRKTIPKHLDTPEKTTVWFSFLHFYILLEIYFIVYYHIKVPSVEYGSFNQ